MPLKTPSTPLKISELQNYTITNRTRQSIKPAQMPNVRKASNPVKLNCRESKPTNSRRKELLVTTETTTTGTEEELTGIGEAGEAAGASVQRSTAQFPDGRACSVCRHSKSRREFAFEGRSGKIAALTEAVRLPFSPGNKARPSLPGKISRAIES